MPILTRFPGGGGDTGYKHYIGNTKNISVKTGASNTVCLNWEDPENFIVDGNTLSEWKGSIVVAKEGTPPQSIDDGIRIAEVTEKNKYKVTELITEIGGSGYYYGIFPYTKDFVVNEDTSNTKLLEATLENSSWSLIDDMSRTGRASALWSVGDRKEVSIEGYGKVKFQIAGFEHDDLTDGTGKAGITFIAESLVGSLTVTQQLYNGITNLENLLLEIKDKLPPDLKSVIKNVSHKWGNTTQMWEECLFCPSAMEVGFSGAINNAYKAKTFSDIFGDIKKYKLFENVNYGSYKGPAVMKDLDGNACAWHIREIRSYIQNGSTSNEYLFYVDETGQVVNRMGGANITAKLCLMFCV